MTDHQTASRFFDRPLPEGYREEISAHLATRQTEAARQNLSVLLFQLGELKLALPTSVASAVAATLHVARIPHRSGTVLLGLAAHGGDILPCCSLSRLLNLTETRTAAARTLLLDEGASRRWAVPVDAVLGVHFTHDGHRIDPSAALAPRWLLGSYHEESTGDFHLLNQETLFRQITLATA